LVHIFFCKIPFKEEKKIPVTQSKGSFTQAIYAAILVAIFVAIPNRSGKLAAISWRFRGNFLAILLRFYDFFFTEHMRC